jgi:GNAT superfamily N-acetyltransferase
VSDLEIRQHPYGDPVARAMVDTAMADLVERYGGAGDDNPIADGEFDPPNGGFLVGWLDGVPVVCGGWRSLTITSDSGTPELVAEIKRMYAVPAARGTGAAATLLRAIEQEARDAGMHRLVLETGGRNPEAIAFYAKQGYERITNYGYYREYPDCVSFGLEL